MHLVSTTSCHVREPFLHASRRSSCSSSCCRCGLLSVACVLLRTTQLFPAVWSCFKKRQLTNDRRLSRSGDAGRRRVSQPAVVADDQRLGGPAVERRVGADRLRVADHAVDDRRRTRPARQRHPDRLQRSSVGRRAPQRQRRHLARSLPGDLA